MSRKDSAKAGDCQREERSVKPGVRVLGSPEVWKAGKKLLLGGVFFYFLRRAKASSFQLDSETIHLKKPVSRK
jgi:hypothetical protein